jgi:hypothetical protein
MHMSCTPPCRPCSVRRTPALRRAKLVKRVGVLEETAIANVKKMIESHKSELQAAFEKRDPDKRGWCVGYGCDR